MYGGDEQDACDLLRGKQRKQDACESSLGVDVGNDGNDNGGDVTKSAEDVTAP